MSKKKLNNKGFAVSAMLYTLLTAFLLFLGASLAQFSSSAKILSSANSDLTDGIAYDIKAICTNCGFNGGETKEAIDDISKFPYEPSIKPSKSGHKFIGFKSTKSVLNSATLSCNSVKIDYGLPIKYGNIKKFVKDNKCSSDVEIRYTANFETNEKSTLYNFSPSSPTPFSDTSVFNNSNIKRDEIETIEFKGTIDIPKNIPDSNIWVAGNNVRAYYTKNSETGRYKVVIVGNDTIYFPKDSSFLFNGYKNLKSITFGNYIDTSDATKMYSMFRDCSSLTSLDVSKFNTPNVTDMEYMFSGCSNLTSLDVSKFDTSKVTSMRWMFNNCSSLTSLDLSNFYTSNVTDMSFMFENCSSLTRLNIKNFTFKKVESYSSMLNKVPSSAIIYVNDQDAYNFINAARNGDCTPTKCPIG